MKYFTYIALAIAIGLIIFNVTKLDFEHLLHGESMIALMCIISILCAICILFIYNTSKAINEKTK